MARSWVATTVTVARQSKVNQKSLEARPVKVAPNARTKVTTAKRMMRAFGPS
jgi:hypothetical protein